MRVRRTTIGLGTILGILTLVLLLTTGASSRDQHCSVRVIGQEDTGQFILSEEVCFDTYNEVLSNLQGTTGSDATHRLP